MDNFRKSIFAPKNSLVPVTPTCIRRNENKIVLNVGGVKFETFKTTLKSIPDTRLSWLTDNTANNSEYDPVSGEYFFDRHSGMFHMILNYYRTGKLHIPMDVCGPAFEEELGYWGLDETQIEPCCWNTYRAHRDAQQTLAEFEGHDNDLDSDDEEETAMRERFGISDDFIEVKKTCWQRWRPQMWSFLDNPKANKASKIFAITSVIFIITSIATFCLETHKKFRFSGMEHNITEKLKVSEIQRQTRPLPFLSITEYICIAFFTMELFLRIIVCPSKLTFIKDAFNWIDLFSILPFFVARIIGNVWPEFESTNGFLFLNALRLIRIFRILKLTRHFSGLKILGHTIRASAKELFLLFLVLIIGVLIFGVLIFYAEQFEEGDKNDFHDIPIAFYWAVVTMTTLGYGDLVPRTMLGYIVGTMCAVSGLLMLSLPVPIIVSNFTLYYSHAQAKMKLPKKTKNILVGAATALKEHSYGTLTPPEEAQSLSGSETNIFMLERKDSSDSALGSCNSTESPAIIKENKGISVIYTDEISRIPVVSLSPTTVDSPGITKRRKLSDITECPHSPTEPETIIINPRRSLRRGSIKPIPVSSAGTGKRKSMTFI